MLQNSHSRPASILLFCLVPFFVTTRELTAFQLAFEVASIKPSDPDATIGLMGCYQAGSTMAVIPAGRCIARQKSLRTMVAEAYGFPLPSTDWVKGGPSWVDKDIYDIEAKAEDPKTSTADLRLMFQALLAERFKLRVHYETRETTELALMVAKGGPKLKSADPNNRVGSMESYPTSSAHRITTKRFSIDNLARSLSFGERLGPVINRTNLTGEYEFTLTWAATDEVPGPSLSTALQEQLGLKLESTKGPIKILVIDSAEKPILN